MQEYRPHMCNVCGKRFKQGNQLRQHATIHLPPDQRPFKCEVCEKTFTRSHHLKLHRMAHTRQSPFQCDICGRNYKQACNLRWHMMMHDESKQQTCMICGRNFICEKALAKHMYRHIPKETYTCVFCNKVLLQKNMAQHQAMHTNGISIHCKVCNKRYLTEDQFEAHASKHMRKPNNEHICILCGKKFRRIGNYENHMILHSGYMPYTCEHCGKHYLQMGSYKKHLKSHIRSMATDNVKENKVPQGFSKPSKSDISSTIAQQNSDRYAKTILCNLDSTMTSPFETKEIEFIVIDSPGYDQAFEKQVNPAPFIPLPSFYY